jgi:type IV pilus assembly protein PilV
MVKPHPDINAHGFSFLEVLVGLAMLSVGVLALAGLQGTALEGNAASRNLTSAVFLAEAKVSELKAGGYSSLAGGTVTDPNNPLNEQGQSGGIFRRSWTISNDGANMKRITVAVSWKDRRGGDRSTSLETLVSDSID